MPSITRNRATTASKSLKSPAEEPQIVIPVLAGTQNGRQFFTAMMSGHEVARYLNIAAKQGTTDAPAFAGHDRIVQRTIQWTRVDQLIKFILKGLPKADGSLPVDDYALSALTVAFDPGDEFEFDSGDGAYGHLRLDPGTTFYVADGQHRAGAIQKAIALMDAVGDECIPVTLYLYRGDQHLRNLFIFLNKFGKTPDASLMVALDDNSALAQLTRTVAKQLPFADRFMVEGGSSVGSKEKHLLFTLKGFEHACALFAAKEKPEKTPDLADRMVAFWLAVVENMPLWQEAIASQDCSHIRADTLALHLVALKGIAVASVQLRDLYSEKYLDALGGLASIDWKRDAAHWIADRVIVDNRLSVSKATIDAIAQVVATACIAHWEGQQG